MEDKILGLSTPKDEMQAVYEETDLTMSPLTGASDVKDVVRKDIEVTVIYFHNLSALPEGVCVYSLQCAQSNGVRVLHQSLRRIGSCTSW
jgi:hypothetical protein